MAAMGFQYDRPFAIIEDFLGRLGPLSTTKYEGGNVDAELQALLEDEIAAAVADVPCRAAYVETYRAAVLDRFDEFRTLFDEASTDPG